MACPQPRLVVVAALSQTTIIPLVVVDSDNIPPQACSPRRSALHTAIPVVPTLLATTAQHTLV